MKCAMYYIVASNNDIVTTYVYL